MPVAKIQLPDGRVARFDVPDGTSPQDVLTQAENMFGGGVKAPTMAGPQSMEQSLSQQAQEMGPGQSAIAGFGTKLNDYAMRAKQLITGSLAPQDVADIQAGRQLRGVSPAAAAGAAGGAAVVTAPVAPASFLGSVAAGGALGAAEPTIGNETTLPNVGRGALASGVGYAIPKVAAKMLHPITPSPEVQALLDRGVVPTPGQAVGGTINRIEQKLSSLPIIGDIINSARSRPKLEFNKAALNIAMPPGAGEVSQAGNAGLQEVKSALGSAYDRLYAGKDVQVPQALFSTLQQSKNVPVLPLNSEGKKTFDAVLRKSLWDRIPAGGTLPAENVKAEIIGDIGKAARQLQGSSAASEKAVGDALMAARSSVQQWLNSATGAQNVGALDKAYAAKVALEKATGRAAAQGGVFTPYQALTAARNSPDLRTLAQNAQSVLGNTVPNSYTADRGLLAGAFLRPTELATLQSLLGVGIAAPLYSRPSSRFLLGDLIPGQAAGAAALRSTAPYTGIAGATLAPQLRDYLNQQ